MKVVLATDPVFWPLTGIGKYTFELANRLGSEPRISDIRYFNMGHWQSAEALRRSGLDDGGNSAEEGLLRKSFGIIRKALSSNQSAIKVYSRITPHLYRHRLKPFSADYIFHSPNFMLPPFTGKKVATFHDLSVFKYPEFHPEARVLLLKPEIIKSAEEADHIITDSEAVKREVVEYFARSPQDVTAIPLASSLGGERPDQAFLKTFLDRHGLSNEHFFLFVSTIEPRKNIDRILDAYESLPEKTQQQYPLVLTGSSGWKSEGVLKRIDTLGQNGLVHYLGYSSDAELRCLYATARALIFPSIYEGFGLPIIEAQAMGLPVVTSKVSCMPEVAGDAALFVDPFDAESIAAALERVTEDAKLRDKLKMAGLENSGQYSWDITADKTLQVYSRMQSQR